MINKKKHTNPDSKKKNFAFEYVFPLLVSASTGGDLTATPGPYLSWLLLQYSDSLFGKWSLISLRSQTAKHKPMPTREKETIKRINEDILKLPYNAMHEWRIRSGVRSA